MSGTSGSDDRPRTKRRQLAVELARVRRQAGISGRELATQIGISQSKVSRIEAGTTIPSLPQVETWAAAVKATEETRRSLVALTEAAFGEVHSWNIAFSDRPHLQDEFKDLEDRARAIRTFQLSVVPGLLQIAEYARRVFSFFDPAYSEEGLAAAVATRLQRQLALYAPDREFEFLISEAALRWRPGPPRLMLAQLDRITSIGSLGNVVIGVIPQNREATVSPMHGFVIYEGGGGQGDVLVEVETAHAGLTVTSPADVALYRRQWARLAGSALYGDEAGELISGIAAEMAAQT
ncbi:helix-turn-helix domain-containing protein [Sinosporangium siamense]|uniref:Transcriptional regulator n=1 Tax=Sinosporangium siamense TaxID=1367973 RepID=A0A919V9M7_9ACTN|nr:helix-turn-helix transcriptional regulator [Sinosporangium siamense]GII95476.1 transcriptional regulator [Sinosporangium siamense]